MMMDYELELNFTFDHFSIHAINLLFGRPRWRGTIMPFGPEEGS